jgi:hypothetical protein
MGLIAFASIKGSPGVTTTALALGAASLDDSDVIVAELDPSGGDLAARFGRPFEPGLTSLAAAARRPTKDARLTDHCQEILGSLRVIVGQSSGDRSETVLRMLSERGLWRQLAEVETLLLADCGRFDPRSAALPIMEASTALVVVCRPMLNELQHVHSRLPALRRIAERVAVTLIGDGPYGAAEVGESLDVDVLGTLAVDRDAARLLNGEPGGRRALARLPLLRSASAVMRALNDRLSQPRDTDTLIEGSNGSGASTATAIAVVSVP